MAIPARAGKQIRIADKARLRRKMEEINKELGVVPVPGITIEKLREMMIAEGIRPEDNEFSREIIRMRYGEDAEAEDADGIAHPLAPPRSTRMATQPKTEPPVRFADKEALNRLMDELEERMGFVPDPDATIEKLREMLLADGVRPEECAASREILRMRYGDEAEE